MSYNPFLQVLAVILGLVIAIGGKAYLDADVASHKRRALPDAVLIQKEDDFYFQNDKYRQDTRTGLCFLTHGPHGLTNVPCTDDVLAVIQERKVD